MVLPAVLKLKIKTYYTCSIKVLEGFVVFLLGQ